MVETEIVNNAKHDIHNIKKHTSHCACSELELRQINTINNELKILSNK